ncbi:tRNA (cytosine-5-)-methyltransferase [Sparganum proliferum]
MSPPCQPFTRMGKRKLGEDNRSLSFHRVITLIQTYILVSNKKSVRPAAIFLENVKGFELSDAWKELLEALFHSGYEIRQFLLTPLQFGIPNCRLRFYLVAIWRGSSEKSSFSFSGSLPASDKANSVSDMLQLCEKSIIRLPPPDAPSLPNCDFLLPDADLPDNLRLSAEKVTKFYRALDIVTPDSHKSACFTKGYSQRFEGTGSFLLLPGDNSTARASGNASKNVDDFPKLRYFHSQEVANLMCFPPSFKFPPEISEKQRLRLLGNSINVFVVAHVMYWAFSPKTQG